jgi:hypothetical protein
MASGAPGDAAEWPGGRSAARHNDTESRRKELWNKLTSDSEWSSPSGEARHVLSKGDPSNISWAIGYRVSQMTGWAGDMDELLSSDNPRFRGGDVIPPKAGITPEQRARLRSDIAALCYALTEPDAWMNPPRVWP